MGSTEIPVYGEQEQSGYNGHFESTGYHPMLLFNRGGDCLAAKLRRGSCAFPSFMVALLCLGSINMFELFLQIVD